MAEPEKVQILDHFVKTTGLKVIDKQERELKQKRGIDTNKYIDAIYKGCSPERLAKVIDNLFNMAMERGTAQCLSATMGLIKTMLFVIQNQQQKEEADRLREMDDPAVPIQTREYTNEFLRKLHDAQTTQFEAQVNEPAANA